MKSILIFAALLSLSFQDICQIPAHSYQTHPNSSVQILPAVQDIKPGQFVLISDFGLQPSFKNHHDEALSDQIFCRTANLQSDTFRNQLLSNFNTTMLRKLRKSQSILSISLNEM